MGAKVGGASGGSMDEINVTPLIDIVLVLLIIFMVITPMTVQKLPTELPPKDDAPPPPPDPNKKQLMVAVYKDNTFALNLQPITEEKLRTELEAQLKGRVSDERNVFIDAHPDAKYEVVVHVADLSREMGAERVGFADLKDEGPVQLTPEQLLQMSAPPPADPAAPTP